MMVSDRHNGISSSRSACAAGRSAGAAIPPDPAPPLPSGAAPGDAAVAGPRGANARAARDGADLSDLLRAANRGDAVAYAGFLRAVAPVLRGIVRARGRSSLGEAACEDIVQEVLLAIHLKRHTWRAEDPVRPWLYAIARYKVVDAFRARGRRIDLPVEDFADVLPAPEGPDPTERRDMDRMIALLEPRAADIVRGIGLDGDSIAATGARLGMTEGAVRVALHRAFRRLAALRERHIE